MRWKQSMQAGHSGLLRAIVLMAMNINTMIRAENDTKRFDSIGP